MQRIAPFEHNSYSNINIILKIKNYTSYILLFTTLNKEIGNLNKKSKKNYQTNLVTLTILNIKSDHLTYLQIIQEILKNIFLIFIFSVEKINFESLIKFINRDFFEKEETNEYFKN